MHVLHQTTVPTSDHWRRLQHTFRCFRTKTPCGQENEGTQKRSHDVPDVVDKKETAFSFVLYKILDILYFGRDVGYYSNIKQSWKYSSDFVQNFAGKKRVLLCSANAWIGIHATFLVIPNQCCHFSVVQSFKFKFTTHPTYIQGKHSRSVDWKYNYRECWCYIIRIKQCFPSTNQWLFLHVLAICL